MDVARHRVIAAVIVLLTITIVFAGAVVGRRHHEIWAIGDAFKRERVDLGYSDRLQSIASPFVKGTRFEGRVNTTMPPSSGYLNIYVAQVENIGLEPLKCNCAYVGSDTVVCDKIFLDTFANSISFRIAADAVKNLLGQVDTVFEKWLAAWIIGHEIGHAVLHDDSGNFARLRSRGAAFSQAVEVEADRFFARRIPEADIDRATFALTTFAFQMVSASFDSGSATGGGVAKIRPTQDEAHLPWLIRTLSVAKTVSELKTGTGSGEEFYGALLEKVRIDRNGLDLGTFCDSSSMRAKANEAMKARAGHSAAASQ